MPKLTEKPSTIRTRFAPSPTGYLHIGGARTALYSWLYARHTGGQFILRIEDTDLERSTPESVEAILQGMAWLNLDYDEGPFYQTQRFDRYHAVLEQLLQQGKAYRCACSKERLETLRAEQTANKQKPRYDGHCRDKDLPANHPNCVVRFRNPQEGEVVIEDRVHGRVVFQNAELDDLIIARADGTPTYNFTVVVDDYDMQITHVIRGDDHLNNTPRQINLLKALDVTPPIYAHLPMILGSDGKRLSKRHGAVSVLQYQEAGYLPEALLNYLVRLGWSHGDQEIFSRDEMVEFFDLTCLNQSPAAFNTEKCLWLNQHYLKNSAATNLVEDFKIRLDILGIDTTSDALLSDIIALQQTRVKTLQEMAEKSAYFFVAPEWQDTSLLKKHVSDQLLPLLKEFYVSLQQFSDWQDEPLNHLLKQFSEEKNIKLGDLAQALRVILTGGTVSPPLQSTLRILGSSETLKRIERALALC